MSTAAKVLVVLNVILAAAFLGTAANYLGNQDTWKVKGEAKAKVLMQEIATKDASLSEANTNNGTLSAQLNSANGDRDRAQNEATRLKSHNEQLKEAYSAVAENLGIAQRSVDRMTNTIKAKDEHNDSLQKEVVRQREMIASLTENRDQLNQRLNASELALSRAQSGIKDNDQKIATMAEDLRKAEFSLKFFRERFPGVEAISQPAHSGQILAADNSNNVYVISLGAEDGVKPGFQYMVSRGSQYVGQIVIDDVQNRKAAGRAVRGMSKGSVQVGDTVLSGK